MVCDRDTGPRVAGRVDLMDVRTGKSRPLIAEWGSHGTNESATWLATDYLGAPAVRASPPPRPWDPRWVVGLAGVGSLLGALVIWGSRGRRV